MKPDKPFSPACERNRTPILELLRTAFADRSRVLEVGSGTGQHAVHFAAHLPHLSWQPSDRCEALAGLALWCAEAGLPNLRAPIELDALGEGWPQDARFDAAFTANTLHIMDWSAVQACFVRLDRALARSATLVVYGPFIQAAVPTSDSNRAFDAELRARHPAMGLRHLDDVSRLAAGAGFAPPVVHALPANNLGLVFVRG